MKVVGGHFIVAGGNPWPPPLNDSPGLVFTPGGLRLGNPKCTCCLWTMDYVC